MSTYVTMKFNYMCVLTLFWNHQLNSIDGRIQSKIGFTSVLKYGMIGCSKSFQLTAASFFGENP